MIGPIRLPRLGSLLKREGYRGARRRLALSPALLSVVSFVCVLVPLVVLLDWWGGLHREVATLNREGPAGAPRAVAAVSDRSTALASVEIEVPANGTITIGHAELGQAPVRDSAEERHIELSARPSIAGDVLTVRNVAELRRLELGYDGPAGRIDLPAERFWIPPTGAQFQVGGTQLTFAAVGATGLDLTLREAGGATRQFRFRRAAFGQTHEPLTEVTGEGARGFDPCVPPSGLQRWLPRIPPSWINDVRSAMRGVVSAGGEDEVILNIGGRLSCRDGNVVQIGVEDAAIGWRHLVLLRRAGHFFLAPGNDAARHGSPIVARINERTTAGFSQIIWPVAGPASPFGRLVSITAGRASYRVELERRRVRLVPTRNVSVFSATLCRESPEETTGCPRPATEVRPGSCTTEGAVRQCWESAFSPLDRTGGQGLANLYGRSGFYRVFRWAFIGGAVLLSLVLSGVAGQLVRFVLGRGFNPRGGARPMSAFGPVIITGLSAIFAFAPEIAGLAGRQLTSQEAMLVLLANWGLAGLVIALGPSRLVLGLLWLALTMLAMIGSTSLAAMAVDGGTSQWVEYFLLHKYLFLDLVPPLVVAVASARYEELRVIMRELVVGTRPVYAFVRWAPALFLAGIFLLWFFVGSQTGLGAGNLQPVEAGKLAATILFAVALLGFDRDVRRQQSAGVAWRSLRDFLLVIGFFAALLFLPVLRSDYSPAVIVGLAMGVLLLAYLGPVIVQVFAAAWRRRQARYVVPMTFRPKVKRGWGGRVQQLVAIVAVLIAIVAFHGPIERFGARALLNVEQWPATWSERLANLEQALGRGRNLPIERVIAWIDLSYEETGRSEVLPSVCRQRAADEEAPANVTTAPNGCYRDIEFQLLLSRTAVAHAPCGLAPPFSGGLERGPFGVIAFVRSLTAEIAPMLPTLRSGGSCAAPGQQPAAPPEGRRDRLLQPAGSPINVPVVRNDFVGAYVVGRFGANVGLMLVGAQLVFLIAGLAVFLRCQSMQNEGEIGFGRFIGVLAAGAITLNALQWLLAWSNVLGLLPVMGQPMTWIAYATSHHLFVAIPSVLILIVAGRIARPRIARGSPRTPPRAGRRWLP